MIGAEEVVIDIIANDKATSLLENVRGKLIEINNLSSKYATAISGLNQKINNSNVNIPKVTNDTGSSGGKSSKVDPSQTKLSDFTVTPKVDANSVPREIQSRLDNFKPTVTPKVNTPKIDTKPIDDLNSKVSNVSNNIPQSMSSGTSSVDSFNKSVGDASKGVSDFGKNTSNSVKVGVSAFHEMNNLMVTVGGQFTNLSNQIAGIFGAAGLSGMVEKMWKGATERQTNMLYLMHQKGTEQANTYYNEIMDIVTQLPGDDTFLTNILNLSAAMDKNIKVDKLKELGTAITDYYIASTMKGEIPFEVQRDMRKYITTGETRPLRNSIIANEIDLLKNKNTVLERGQALQEALKKNGFEGMSQYESATNELEELKGHFQKAFADIGTAITSVAQPIMKFYNTMDTVFGSRLSQGIILVATAFIGLFAAVGLTMVIIPTIIRNFEIVGMQLRLLKWVVDSNVVSHGALNTVITMLIGTENAEAIAVNGSVVAGIRQLATTYNLILAKKLNIAVNEGETASLWALSIASLSAIKNKIIEIGITIKRIIFGQTEASLDVARAVIQGKYASVVGSAAYMKAAENAIEAEGIRVKILARWTTIKDTISVIANTVARTPNIIARWLKTDATLAEIIAEEVNTLSENKNTSATLFNALSKLKKVINTIELIGSILFLTIVEWLNTDASLTSAYAHVSDTVAKIGDTEATLGLATATAILDVVMAPITLTILAIVGAIIALIIVIEKVGEAFGWWSDFGSMFQAIADGINRIWNAFVNSDIVQGIISYFQKFVASIQYVIESLQKMFGLIFGQNNGEFDIVQTIIDLFGKLGDIIMWVWNLMDDWSNSPLGIITWLNPLGVLIFHLDEIGSLFEDIGDAINRFIGTTEFQDMVKDLNEAFAALQEPFQEIWSLINEIISAFSEVFNSEDPEGQGTEKRINFLVELLKGLSFVIRVVLVPAIRNVALVVRIVLTPLRVVLTIIKFITGAIGAVTGKVRSFGNSWGVLKEPLNWLSKLGDMIKNVINRIIEIMNYIGLLKPIMSYVDWQVNGLIKIFYQVVDALKYIVGIVNQVGDMIAHPMKIVTAIIDGLKSVFDGLINVFKVFLGYIAQILSYFGILEPVINIINSLIQQTTDLVNGLLKPILAVIDAVKNSIVGKLLGWDKDNNNKDNNNQDNGDNKNGNFQKVWNGLYDRMKNGVESSNLDIITKQQVLGELNNQKNRGNNVNNVRNLGRNYNNTNNNRQVIINQNFSEGAMPIDARNMTKKEARKMFIGAFGYRRAVGNNNAILR